MVEEHSKLEPDQTYHFVMTVVYQTQRDVYGTARASKGEIALRQAAGRKRRCFKLLNGLKTAPRKGLVGSYACGGKMDI